MDRIKYLDYLSTFKKASDASSSLRSKLPSFHLAHIHISALMGTLSIPGRNN